MVKDRVFNNTVKKPKITFENLILTKCEKTYEGLTRTDANKNTVNIKKNLGAGDARNYEFFSHFPEQSSRHSPNRLPKCWPFSRKLFIIILITILIIFILFFQ